MLLPAGTVWSWCRSTCADRMRRCCRVAARRDRTAPRALARFSGICSSKRRPLVVYTGTESLLEEPPPVTAEPPPVTARPPPVTPVARPAPVDCPRPPPQAPGPTPVPWVVQATMFAELQAFTSNDLAVPGLRCRRAHTLDARRTRVGGCSAAFIFPTKQSDGTVELTSTV